VGQDLDWIRCDLIGCINTAHLEEIEDQALQQFWQYTQTVVSEGKYSLVVLDELSLAINFGLIPESEVLAFLTKRPPYVDIILSGPQMPKSLDSWI
jgi:cob(I)alamin adenosyltransferase